MIIICFPDFSEEVQRKLITTLYKYGYAKLLQKFYHQKRVFSDGDLHHEPWITKDQYPEYLRKENLNLGKCFFKEQMHRKIFILR